MVRHFGSKSSNRDQHWKASLFMKKSIITLITAQSGSCCCRPIGYHNIIQIHLAAWRVNNVGELNNSGERIYSGNVLTDRTNAKMYSMITSLLVFIGLTNLDMTSATQCLCDTDSVKTAFCNYRYSFRGTVLEVNEVPMHASDRPKRDVSSLDSYSYDLVEPEVLRAPAELSTRVVNEYRIVVDGIYRGVDEQHLKKIVVLYSELNERLCGHVKISPGNGYLFQINEMEWLNPCARVIRFKNLAREERYGLRKLYQSNCKSPN